MNTIVSESLTSCHVPDLWTLFEKLYFSVSKQRQIFAKIYFQRVNSDKKVANQYTMLLINHPELGSFLYADSTSFQYS